MESALLQRELWRLTRSLRKQQIFKNRYLLNRAKLDSRDWVVSRRERTRHLIELGGLIKKSGLVELTGDDRVLLYGWLLELVDILRLGNVEQRIILLRRRGSRDLRASATRAALTRDEIR